MIVGNYIRQAKHLLFSFRHYLEPLTVFMAFVVMVNYIVYFTVLIPQINASIQPEYYLFPEWFEYYLLVDNHVFNPSFITLLILTSLSYKWRKSAVISLRFLWALWFFGLAQIIFNFQHDIYYIGFVVTIFAIFVYYFVKHLLINR